MDWSFSSPQAIMLAVMKKLTYDDEYNFENEVSLLVSCSLCFVLLGEPEAAADPVLVFFRARTRRCLWSTGSSWRCCSIVWLRCLLSCCWRPYGESSPTPCSKSWFDWQTRWRVCWGLIKSEVISDLLTKSEEWSHSCDVNRWISFQSLHCFLFSRSWQTAPFMEVEVAIRLLYMLGEALPASHGAHFSGDTTKASALQDMMRTVSHMTLLTRVLFSICRVSHVTSVRLCLHCMAQVTQIRLFSPLMWHRSDLYSARVIRKKSTQIQFRPHMWK